MFAVLFNVVHFFDLLFDCQNSESVLGCCREQVLSAFRRTEYDWQYRAMRAYDACLPSWVTCVFFTESSECTSNKWNTM